MKIRIVVALKLSLLCCISAASPARAQALPPYEPPAGLLARGEAKKKTGIALLVNGSLNLALGLASAFSLHALCSPSPSLAKGSCEYLGALLYGMAWGGGLVAAHLIGVGLPLYLTGVRQSARAARIRAAYGDQVPPEAWTAYRLQQVNRAPRLRATGIALLAAGAGQVATAAVLFGFMLAPSGNGGSLDLFIAGMTLGGTGLAVLSTGAGLLYHSRKRVSQTPDLRLMLGPTVGLAGNF